ncbi:MAG TPA: DUF3761 domain-containing protein [Longimicrobium sp.]
MATPYDPLKDLKPLIESADKRRRLRNKLGIAFATVGTLGGLAYEGVQKGVIHLNGDDVREASAICVDSTYSYSTTRAGTCAHHHGVRKWLKPPEWFRDFNTGQ